MSIDIKELRHLFYKINLRNSGFRFILSHADI